MSKGVVGPRRLGGPPGSTYWSSSVAKAVLMRVESGESLRAICADPAMPNRSTVRLWAKKLPVFAHNLDRARTAAGWHMRGGRKPLWDEIVAAEVFARLCEGQTLTKICADPEMPSFTTVWKWQHTIPVFGEAVMLARQIQAERFCDQGWDIASEVTPETAYATEVKLRQLRWTTSVLAPRRFGRFKAVTAEVDRLEDSGPQETVFRVRHFERVTGADGKDYVREVADLPAGMAATRQPRPWDRDDPARGSEA